MKAMYENFSSGSWPPPHLCCPDSLHSTFRGLCKCCHKQMRTARLIPLPLQLSIAEQVSVITTESKPLIPPPSCGQEHTTAGVSTAFSVELRLAGCRRPAPRQSHWRDSSSPRSS
eukprot:1825489-Pleurochrysis_carterae.AAC.18